MNLLATILIAFAQSTTWEQSVVAEVNAYRMAADARELAIYGSIAKARQPLAYNQTLSDSGKWWGQALKGTGILAHGWTCNAAGYLATDGKQISRVWLPSYQGWTDFTMRNSYLGIHPTWQSENGYVGKSTDAAFVCYAWSTSGWNDDPTKATGHYGLMVDPDATDAGAGKNTWGSGNASVWLEVIAR